VTDDLTQNQRNLVNIEDEMRKSYLEYAMSVIIGRALPDVRDGLKPVHRRALFAMYDLKNFYNQSYKKSARVVGDVIGKYHPHGDQAAYDTIVRMAQPFAMRNVLVDGQGNFGSVDGDSAAAMRYTEVRLTRLAGEMLADLDKETVDFGPNYDGSLEEPHVMPAPYPNLLVNGSSGIAVGMATNMAPHNLREVVDGCIALINNPEMGLDELQEYIKGPDFPTGGILYGMDGLREAYETGRGRVRVRARANFEEDENGNIEKIIVTELPYQVNKSRLLEHIAGLVKDKKIDGIRDLRDESDRDGMRVVIEVKRDAMPQILLNQLYRMTALQTTFGILNLAIVNNGPQVLSLKALLQHFIDHRRDVVTRRCLFELREKEKREHILLGYVKALENIDRVIELIRQSDSPDSARAGLMQEFELSHIQATEILNMRLQRLTGLERDKILQELEEVQVEITRLRALLADERKLLNLIIEEMTVIRDRYSDDRRTEIVEADLGLSDEDLIPDEDMVVTVTHLDYIKRTPLREYQTQRRAGKGRIGAGTKEEDYVRDMFSTANHDTLLLFTSMGRVFTLKVHQLPEGGRYARGKPIVNLIQVDDGESIRTILPVREFTEDTYMIFATRLGLVKKTDAMAYSRVRSNGLKAIYFMEGDDLISVNVVQGDEHVMLTTRNGQAIRFPHTEIRGTGRVSRGVIGVRLRDEDQVVSMEVLDPAKDILSVTEHGYGKRTPTGEYRITKRGGRGVTTIKTTDRNGKVVAALQVVDDDQVMLMTDGGKIIRFNITDLRAIGRNTQGVRLLRLSGDEIVVGVERVAEVEEDDELEGIEAVEGLEGEVDESGEAVVPSDESGEPVAPSDESGEAVALSDESGEAAAPVDDAKAEEPVAEADVDDDADVAEAEADDSEE
jgi:DNA gyrase subunit A